MSDYTAREIRKANTLANWSFVGVITPLVGWILAAIANSSLKDLSDVDERRQRRINSIKDKLAFSITLSILVLILWGALGVWYNSSLQKEAQRQAAEQAQQEKAAENAERLRHTTLDVCLVSAQQQYEESWKAEADRLGTDGKLPHDTANRLDGFLESWKDDCYRKASFQ